MSKRAEKRATAEIRRARANDRMADKWTLQKMAARITELEAENERLRAALQALLDDWVGSPATNHAMRQAAAALKTPN